MLTGDPAPGPAPAGYVDDGSHLESFEESTVHEADDGEPRVSDRIEQEALVKAKDAETCAADAVEAGKLAIEKAEYPGRRPKFFSAIDAARLG